DQDIVPKGHHDNSRAFPMGLVWKGVLSSLTGLVSFLRDHPAMNRWAIFGRPCGTWVYLRGNAGPIVRDLHDNLIAIHQRADGNCAGTVESANRVVDEIGPNLVELAPMSHDPWKSA